MSKTVIVVGGGPVGLMVSLRLAKAGIPITVLEAEPEIAASPRAAVYQPVAVRELERAGVLDDLREISTQGRRICWRKTHNKEVIAQLERNVTPDYPYENLVLGQHELARVILKHLQKCDGAEVLYGRRVVGLDESERSSVAISTENAQGSKEIFTASYLVGADGGRSSVRRLSNISFEGFTWPQQLVAANVQYPFDKYGYYDGNFMVDKDHWALIAKINRTGLWRVAYGELENLTYEQLQERVPMKFEALFPGPRPLEYKVEMFSPYRIHQRCAATFRKGRVLLAGDAAHLCNPFGGLGLTGGLLDAAALADVLIAVVQQNAPEKLLDKYSEVRRDIFLNVVNPMSQANIRRVCESDPDTVGGTDPFLRSLIEADAEGHQKIRGLAGLAVDMMPFINGIDV